MERTLCQPPTKNESEVQFFYVDVSTLSLINTTYQLQVSRMDDFVLRTGEQFSFNTTAAQPQVRLPCLSRRLPIKKRNGEAWTWRGSGLAVCAGSFSLEDPLEAGALLPGW